MLEACQCVAMHGVIQGGDTIGELRASRQEVEATVLYGSGKGK